MLMKKRYLTLLTALLATTIAFGQTRLGSVVHTKAPNRLDNGVSFKKKSIPDYLSPLAKTTAATIYSEDFGSGSAGSLPTNWNVSSTSGTNWEWRNTPPLGYLTRGGINSTTSSNGFMILRADSIYFVDPMIVPDAYFTSPSYDFTAYPNVGLEFQQWYTNFYDSCFVEVTDNIGGWIRFDVNPNNQLEPAESLENNASLAKINISSVAGGKSNVQIRFHYMGRSLGAYGWLIDDMRFTELDSLDVGVTRTGALLNMGQFVDPVGMIPSQFVDTVWPANQVHNFGQEVSAITINNSIYRGTSQVYSRNFITDVLPVNFYGGVLDQSDSVGILPITPGTYSVVTTASASLDGDMMDNRDTATFMVTEEAWSNESGTYLPGGLWAHYPAQNGNPEDFDMIGSSVTVSPGKFDTLTSISVGFRYNTAPGVKLQCQIYQFLNPSWQHVASSKVKVLDASEISTINQPRFATFELDPENWGATIIGSESATEPQIWAAVLQMDGVGPTDTIRLLTTLAPAFGILKSGGGIRYASLNDGSASFAVDSLPYTTGNASPAIRMNFANGAEQILSVKDATKNQIAALSYPNPANAELNISYTLTESADVELVVTNAIGQVVKTQYGGFVPARQQQKLKVNTADLAPGMYLYTIHANGQKITKRFVVAR